MKTIKSLIAFIFTPCLASAQNNYPFQMDENVFNAIASIFVLGLVLLFILSIVKRLLDSRLKNKIIEKGIPENAITAILKPNSKENENIKWFVILTGLGVAFTLINYTLPLGFHSIAIMAFSLAGSFLGYYFISKKYGN